MRTFAWFLAAVLAATSSPATQVPPKLTIIHFDVNVGDATLLISPDGHGVLIDAGNRGRGFNPIKEFLDRARSSGDLASLDYTIASHYDADHIGGLDELMENGWYPSIAAYDRGNTNLPWFDIPYVRQSCSRVDDADAAFALTQWGTAPTDSCPNSGNNARRASCQIVEYMVAAEAGGRRETLQPGDTIELDHGITIEAIVVNAEDADGNTVDVHFPGRRDDCAANDFSIGLLISYGDFRYLTAGDLTGNPSQDVAAVEVLIEDDAADVDVYHIDHHGSETSSALEFLEAMQPTVAIASNGSQHGHPTQNVVQRILDLESEPAVYLTNRNPDSNAWSGDSDSIADLDLDGYDGIVEIGVWRRSYRVWRWRGGNRLGGGDRYYIKQR